MLGCAWPVCPIRCGFARRADLLNYPPEHSDSPAFSPGSNRRPRVSRIRTPKPADPQPVGDLVSRFLEKSGLAPKVEAAGAVADWAERVGPQIAAVTRATSVSEGTLFVSVATSPWLMELNLMKGELMKRVNAGRKEGKIRQIVFVMAA